MRFRARYHVTVGNDGGYGLEIGSGTAMALEERGVQPRQMVWLVFDEERSMPSHNHYFAIIAAAWSSLPEDIAGDFPTAEHLRKWALIKSGHIAGMTTTVCRSGAEARRWAMFSKRIDKYCIAVVQDRIITVYQAASQSLEAMGKKAFQQSKDDVFDVISQLLGVDVATLGKAAEPCPS